MGLLFHLRVVLLGIANQPLEVVENILAGGHPAGADLVVSEDADLIILEFSVLQESLHDSSVVHTSYQAKETCPAG